MATHTLPVKRIHSRPGFATKFSANVFAATRSKGQWSKVEYSGLAALILLWILKIWSTWANWGTLDIDCGREMYVPKVLAEGKVLYRDIWYLYGPVAPY